MTHIAFLGVGRMGAPMAGRLADAGHELTVWSRTRAHADALADRATLAASPAEAGAKAEVAITMLTDGGALEEVTLGRDGLAESLPAGSLLVDMSTTGPAAARKVAKALEARSVGFVDAPVAGSVGPAAEGTLAIMVGGSEEAYAAARPVLELMGTRVVHAGPIGAGTQMKLARNMMHFVAFTAATEAQRLAEAAGLDLVELGHVVRHTDAITGGPGAIMHRDSTAPLAEDDFWFGVFDHVRALGEKDLSFAIELADTLGVDVPLARQARERLAKGLGLP